MTDKSINQFNMVPNWLNTSKPVPGSIPNANQLNTSLFATPTDSLSLNFGLPPAASGAKAMDANTMPASTGFYTQLADINNLVNGLNVALAAAPMNYTIPNNVNTAAKALDDSSPGNDGYGDSKTDSTPSTLIINNDNVDDYVDDSGTIVPEAGQTLKLTKLTESDLTGIDTTTYESPNKVMIPDSLGVDTLKIRAKAGDNYDFSSDWYVDSVSGNKITLKNSDEQTVTVSGKEVNVTIDGTPLTEILQPGLSKTDLDTLLEGKDPEEIAQLIQDNPTGLTRLKPSQQKEIGKAYAVAYAKQALDEDLVDYSKDLTDESINSDYINLVKKSETDGNYKKALDAALESATEIDGLADAIPASKTSNPDGTPSTPAASSDALITQLQGDKDIPITKENFDQIDFKKIMELDPEVAVKVIKHMDLTGTNVPQDKKLTVAMRDRLAVQFAMYANNDFIVAAGVPKDNIRDDGLNDNDMSAHDFHMLQDAARGCGQGELVRILGVIASERDDVANISGSSTHDSYWWTGWQDYMDKRSLFGVDARMKAEPEKDLGDFMKNPD